MIPKFSVKFYLYKHVVNGKGESPIYIRIIKDRKKCEASINEYLSPEKWEEGKQRAKEKTIRDRQLNHTITKIEEKVYEVRFLLENEKRPFTARSVMDIIKGKHSTKQITLLEYFDKSIVVFDTKKDEYGKPTIMHYKRTRLMLERFLRREGLLDLPLFNTTKKIVLDFESYILTTPNARLARTPNRNTTNKYLNKFKRVLGRAYDEEYIARNPFDGIKLKEPKVDRVFLTDAEIKIIAEHDLGGNASLIRVRDFFLFCTYTGLRFSDAADLRKESVITDKNGRLWLATKQKKTDHPVGLPIINIAQRIYDKYKTHREETGFVLPSISNAKINLYLKQISQICNINKNITTHSARHTFATTITLDQGIGIKTVSELLGHRSVKSTEVYLHISKAHLDEVANKLNKAYT